MKKISLYFQPNFILVISIIGFLIILKSLMKDFQYYTVAYMLAALGVVPLMVWKSKHMEKNIDKYVLVATGQLKTPQEMKEKGPDKVFHFWAYLVILAILNVLFGVPFLLALPASSIILYPVIKKIYLKALEVD